MIPDEHQYGHTGLIKTGNGNLDLAWYYLISSIHSYAEFAESYTKEFRSLIHTKAEPDSEEIILLIKELKLAAERAKRVQEELEKDPVKRFAILLQPPNEKKNSKIIRNTFNYWFKELGLTSEEACVLNAPSLDKQKHYPIIVEVNTNFPKGKEFADEIEKAKLRYSFFDITKSFKNIYKSTNGYGEKSLVIIYDNFNHDKLEEMYKFINAYDLPITCSIIEREKANKKPGEVALEINGSVKALNKFVKVAFNADLEYTALWKNYLHPLQFKTPGKTNSGPEESALIK